MHKNEQVTPDVDNKKGDEMWLDLDTGAIGFGAVYGEHSFNNRPSRAIHGEKAIKEFLQRNEVDPNLGQELVESEFS